MISLTINKGLSVKNSPIPYRLKQARLKKGISQEKLGILAEIDEFSASARMNQYEKGSHFPGYSTLQKCANVLNVPVEFFYAESDETAALLSNHHLMNTSQRLVLYAFVEELSTKNTQSN